MSDAVFAAMIAAGATVFTSVIQLKTHLAKEVAARTPSVQRKSGRMRAILLWAIVIGAAVGGFTISQWFAERQRVEQIELRRELQARVTELSRTASQLQQSHAQTRSEIQGEVLQRLGAEGVLVLATVGPCKPAPAQQPIPSPAPSSTESPAAPAAEQTAEPVCTEADSTPVSICASIPGMAVVSEVELFTRFSDSSAPWSESRVLPGQELQQTRFSEKPTELTDEENTRQVCHTFSNWSTQHGRQARMIVRYSM